MARRNGHLGGMPLIRLVNLFLLILFPIAWAAPLMRAGLLPLFGLSEISVFSGIASLWHADIVLAIIVIVFALIAPIAKVLAVEAHFQGLVPARVKGVLFHLGRLAMADIFLIAIYITVAKGIGVGRLETAWGLYLFTALILASLALSTLAGNKRVEPD